MSSARGFGTFASDKKGVIRMLAISLFALGISAAGLLAYQQFTNDDDKKQPIAISKDEAIRIALIAVNNEPDRDAALLPNEHASAKLIHATVDGIGFISSEESLVDMWLYSNENKFLKEHRNSYLWDVSVATSTNDGDMRGYSYMIDADNGQIIGNDRDYAYFEPWSASG